MTFTPNPLPNYSLLHPENHKNHKNRRNSNHNSHEQQKNRWHYSSTKATPLAANRSNATVGSVQSAGSGSGRAAFLSTLGLSLDCEKSRVAPVISGTKPTRFAAEMNFELARVAPNKHIRSPAADEALCCLLKAGKNDDVINYVLVSYEPELCEEDYVYMLKKLCNTGNFLLAKTCFDFITSKQNGRVAKGMQTSTMIGALGKLGEVNLALRLFEIARLEGYGNTVYSFSAMIGAYGRNGRFRDAIDLFRSMSSLGVEPNLITYNSLIDAGFKGEMNFDEAIDKCKEMERSGIKTDVVTYNALLSGYGKHGMYDEVTRLFEEMKVRSIHPNKLTYFTMIGTYTKGKMFQEAMDVYKEFKMARLEVDVVFYSAIIDELCKIGLVESSFMLLHAMIEKGIKPNVLTFNSIINASRQSPSFEHGIKSYSQATEYPIEESSSVIIDGTFQNKMGGDCILKVFEQLAAEKGHIKKDRRGRQDQHCILWLLKKMHEMHIKPNLATFSAIFKACSCCNSLEDASNMIDALRLIDNQVYDVTHGLLMGYREQVWVRAQTLFEEIEMRHMDSSTVSAFYNALTDMLWNFGQRHGTQMVVIEGMRRNVWNGEWSISCLDLHVMSCGAACVMVHAWLFNMRNTLLQGTELPEFLNILTGPEKHSKTMGDGTLKRAIEALLNGMGSPFRVAESDLGRFVSPGDLVATWLRRPDISNLLVRCDDSQAADPSYNYPALGN